MSLPTSNLGERRTEHRIYAEIVLNINHGTKAVKTYDRKAKLEEILFPTDSINTEKTINGNLVLL